MGFVELVGESVVIKESVKVWPHKNLAYRKYINRYRKSLQTDYAMYIHINISAPLQICHTEESLGRKTSNTEKISLVFSQFFP